MRLRTDVPLKLLFLTQTFPRFPEDTAGPFIQELARGLVRGGDEVCVLAPHAPEVPAAWEVDGVEVRTFRYAPESLELVGYSRSLDRDESLKFGAVLSTPLYFLGALRAVRRLCKQRHFDLVQAHWVVPNALITAPLLGSWFGGRDARARNVPALAVGLHGSDVFLAEKPGVRTAVGWALRRSQVLTGCSPELVDRVAALGFPRDAAAVIPYGVDVEVFRPNAGDAGAAEWRRKLGIDDGAPLVLTVGRMATKKGFQVLLPQLEALLRAHPAAHCVFAGAGDRLREFQDIAGRLDASERVHFPGAVYRDTLPDLYRAADLFVLPAVHDVASNVDGLPNVILEAMASGLPVIASRLSGIPLAVEDGVTGRLVPEQNGEALRQALDDLLGDLQRCRLWGAAGRRKAEAELTWDAVAAHYRAAYRRGIEMRS